MDNNEWQYRIGVINDRFHEDIVKTLSCGPFDGGCVVVAEALKNVIGGSVVVLTRGHNGLADHAAVECDGLLWDYAGPLYPLEFIERFNSSERACCTVYRDIKDDDLVEAYRDEELSKRLSSLFNEALVGSDFVSQPSNSPC